MRGKDPGSEIDPDDVRRWIAETEEDVKRLDVDAERVQRGLASARQRLILYHELLATLTKAPVKVTDAEVAVGRTTRDRTIEAAAEILEQFERPMTIQEIHAAFIRQGRPLPGRGTPTNILAHISTSPTFVRRRRGVYALAAWSPDDTPEPGNAPEPEEVVEPRDAAG